LDKCFFVFLLLVFWSLVRMINKGQLSIDLFDFWKSGALASKQMHDSVRIALDNGLGVTYFVDVENSIRVPLGFGRFSKRYLIRQKSNSNPAKHNEEESVTETIQRLKASLQVATNSRETYFGLVRDCLITFGFVACDLVRSLVHVPQWQIDFSLVLSKQNKEGVSSKAMI
jgi:hypothetical protein